jgi:hypothetical protein
MYGTLLTDEQVQPKSALPVPAWESQTLANKPVSSRLMMPERN